MTAEPVPTGAPTDAPGGGDLVRCERRAGGVALVRVDRPKANAFSRRLLTEFDAVLDGLSADLPGAVVVWGGPRIFAAGGDIAEMGGPEDAAELVGLYRSVFDKVAALPRMVVAAVNGYALGGGCELALAADFRVAGESAVFGVPEIHLGLVPGGGGTQRLTRLIGPARTKDLVVTGRRVGAAEALALGLADRVVPDGDVLEEAFTMAGAFAAGPLVAQATAKELIDRATDRPLADGLDAEGRAAVALHRTEDAREGLRSFLENGPGRATFRGR